MSFRFGRVRFNRERFTVFTELSHPQSLADNQLHTLTHNVLLWFSRRKLRKLLAQAEIYESAPETLCCRISRRLSSLNRKLDSCNLDRIDVELDFLGKTIFIHAFLRQQ